MFKTRASKGLWDYCGVYVSEYDWYQPVWYYDGTGGLPEDKKALGRWLGVAHRVGQAMCYWILPIHGIPIARSTVQPVSADEMKYPKNIDDLKAYDDAVRKKIDGPEAALGAPSLETLFDVEDKAENISPFEPEASMLEADDFTEETFDNYITAQGAPAEGVALFRPQAFGAVGISIGGSWSVDSVALQVVDIEETRSQRICRKPFGSPIQPDDSTFCSWSSISIPVGFASSCHSSFGKQRLATRRTKELRSYFVK
jgi:hypothetical protein